MSHRERDPEELYELKAALLARAEEIAEDFLGPRNKVLSSSQEWRWGTKGSAALRVRGPKRGLFHSHEAGTGGSLIDLIMFARGCTVSEAIRLGKERVGLTEAAPDSRAKDDAARRQREQERERKQAEAEAEESQDQSRRIAYARRLWAEAAPIAGTLAEQYLVSARKIPCQAGGWPDVVRFHAPSRALILAATSGAGEVQAVQRVYLTTEGRKIDTAEIEARRMPAGKQTSGVLVDGAAVRLPAVRVRQVGDPTPVMLAEGPETGLSVWAATGHETMIALGSFAKLAPLPGRVTVLCRDDDKLWSPADRALRKRLAEWRQAGIDIRVATPWPSRRQDRSDFNDTMQADGAAAIAMRVAAALASPAAGRRRLPVDKARQVLGAAIGRFFKAAEAHHAASADARAKAEAEAAPIPDYAGPKERRRLQAIERERIQTIVDEQAGPVPVHAIRVDVGAGKSMIARQRAAEMLAAMRAAGDKRAIVIAVPTHDLGDEQAAAFEALPESRAVGLKAAVWRGRERDDPDAPGQTMCRDLARVRDANEAVVAVQPAVCKRRVAGEDVLCPLFHVCGYQQQLVRAADVWIVAHELLFSQKPAAIGDVAAVIVDETAWQDGLSGISGRDTTLALDTLQSTDEVPGSIAGTVVLGDYRRRAFDALAGLTDGPLTAEALHLAGMTAKDAADARALEWSRKVDPQMHPGMSDRERKAAVVAAATNAVISKLSTLWQAIEALLADGGPAASGWAALGRVSTEEGHVRCLVLKGRRPVREGWHAPTLLIDATLNVDLLRYHWPTVELTADVAVETPHMRVRQVTDSSFSKNKLIPWNDAADAVKRSAARNLRDAHATIAATGRRHAPGKVLAVVQLGVEMVLPGLGPLPANVELAHHNAIAGRDEWRDAAALVVVGRTAPSPASVERIAEALTGAAMTPLPKWYERACVTREMADGAALEAEADRHPDPTAEAIRWRVCEGELVQIIGRARGSNRTDADPVDVLVMTDVPLPLPVNETLLAADLEPGPRDLMLAAGGVAFKNPTDAATAYPAIWANRECAKKAFERAGWPEVGDKPVLDNVYYGFVPNLALTPVRYRLAGAGRRPAVALVDLALIPSPETWLVERLGIALAAFEVVGQGEPPPRARPSEPEQLSPVTDTQPDSSVPADAPLAAASATEDSEMLTEALTGQVGISPGLLFPVVRRAAAVPPDLAFRLPGGLRVEDRGFGGWAGTKVMLTTAARASAITLHLGVAGNVFVNELERGMRDRAREVAIIAARYARACAREAPRPGAPL